MLVKPKMCTRSYTLHSSDYATRLIRLNIIYPIHDHHISITLPSERTMIQSYHDPTPKHHTCNRIQYYHRRYITPSPRSATFKRPNTRRPCRQCRSTTPDNQRPRRPKTDDCPIDTSRTTTRRDRTSTYHEPSGVRRNNFSTNCQNIIRRRDSSGGRTLRDSSNDCVCACCTK